VTPPRDPRGWPRLIELVSAFTFPTVTIGRVVSQSPIAPSIGEPRTDRATIRGRWVPSLGGMDAENSLGQFLRARRELLRPEDFGLPAQPRRRVPGLRREELALLAGVSADYYIRLEQGRDQHPSAQVLDALARALDLDDEATAHLHELARPVPRRQRAAARPERVNPDLQRLLDTWVHTPATVLGRRMDVLAHNALARALYQDFTTGTNLLRAIFLDPATQQFYADWDRVARDTVAALRASSGIDLDDPRPTHSSGNDGSRNCVWAGWRSRSFNGT
jgi:transcriptional regulator with XRE-family HTH domain